VGGGGVSGFASAAASSRTQIAPLLLPLHETAACGGCGQTINIVSTPSSSMGNLLRGVVK
jgi:hypothetical protein